MADAAPLDQLQSLVAANWSRVRDLFAMWDENGDGMLSLKEWCKVITSLGISRADAQALFEQLDVDANGTLDLKELHHALRPHVEVDAKLKDGAVQVQTSSANNHALRTEIQTSHSRVLGNVTLQMGPGDTVLAQIRNALAASFARVRELWVEWDDDGSGSIDPTELFHALTLLGLPVSRPQSDELFSELDQDASGTIEFNELKRALDATATVEIDAALRAGAVAFDKTAKNKFATRKNGPGKTGSNVVSGLQLSTGAGAASVVEQLRQALVENLARTIDLFREWDADSSGTIDKAEFHKALTTLGLQASKAESNELFESLDDDKSGTIEFGELHAKLRRSGGGMAQPSVVLPRHLRGPVTVRDTLLQMLPRLGPRLIAALNEVRADEEDDASRRMIETQHFVQALDSLAPLTETGRQDGKKLSVQGKRLHDELRGIFRELIARNAAAAASVEAGGEPRLPIKAILSMIRALAKEGDANSMAPAARGAALMAANQNVLTLPAIAPPNVRVLFVAAVRSGLTADLIPTLDTLQTGMISRDAFCRDVLPALHISATTKEANAMFTALDVSKRGELSYTDLEANLHELEPTRGKVKRSRAKRGTPRTKSVARSKAVGGLIDTIGAAYYLPAAHHSGISTYTKISPRVHDRVRPEVREPLLPDIPTPRKSPRKPNRASTLPRDPLTGEVPKASPPKALRKHDLKKLERPSDEGDLLQHEDEAIDVRDVAGEDNKDELSRSLPAFSPRHAKLLAKANGTDVKGGGSERGSEVSSATPLKLPEQVPWCPTGRRRNVPLYTAAKPPDGLKRPSLAAAGGAPLSDEQIEAQELAREKRERQARNKAIERVKLAKAEERIKELEKRLEQLAPGEPLADKVPFVSGGIVMRPGVPAVVV